MGDSHVQVPGTVEPKAVADSALGRGFLRRGVAHGPGQIGQVEVGAAQPPVVVELSEHPDGSLPGAAEFVGRSVSRIPEESKT